jgi:hypothetical protein
VSRLRRSIQVGTALVVVVLAAYVLSSVTSLDAVVSTLTQTRPLPYAVAVGCYFLTIPIRTYRWRVYLAEVGVSTDSRDTNLIVFLSLFFNTFLPAKAGDLYRCHLTERIYETTRSRVLGTVTVERVADIVVLGTGLIVSVLFVASDSFGRSGAVVGVTVAVLAVVSLGFVVLTSLPESLLPERLRGVVHEFQTALTVVRSPRILSITLVTTGSIWGLNVVRLWFIVDSLGGSLPFRQVVLVALLVSLLTGLPYTPGGIGFVEAGGASVLLSLGVGGAFATSVVLLDRLITVVTVGVLGGIVYTVLVVADSQLLDETQLT